MPTVIGLPGRGILWLAMLAFLPAAWAQSVPQRGPGTRTVGGREFYSIEGRVVGSDGQAPIRLAQVTLVDRKGVSLGTVITDDEGTFYFADVVAGTYELEIQHSDYASYRERLAVALSSQRGLRIVLRERRENALPKGMPPLVAAWSLRVPDDAREEYEKGIAKLRAGQRKESRAHFEEAVRRYPEYAAAHAALGAVHLMLGDHDAAREAFEAGLAVDANLADAALGLGALYGLERRYAEAEKHLQQAARLKPDDWRVHYEMGSLYLNAQQPEKAEPCLQRAADLHQGFPRVYLLLINSLALQQKLPEALEIMDAYLQRFPNDSFAAQVRKKRALLASELAARNPRP